MIHMNTEITAKLDQLGFTNNGFVETILITSNKDGSFNPAPMGVIRHDKLLEIRPYKSSKTYRNLMNSNRVSINVTDDPMLFLESAFKDELDRFRVVDDWVLNGSDATLIAEKVSRRDISEQQASFTLEPVTLSISNKMPSVFSRGRAEAIEAIIHATRVKVFHTENHEDKVKEFIEKMVQSFNIISRVSDSSSAEVKIVQILKSLLEKWGVEI
jgi:uncharacterized protein